MDFNRDWTAFAVDAEHDAYGSIRICEAYNKLRAETNEVLGIHLAQATMIGELRRALEELCHGRVTLSGECRFCGAPKDVSHYDDSPCKALNVTPTKAEKITVAKDSYLKVLESWAYSPNTMAIPFRDAQAIVDAKKALDITREGK